MSSFSAEPFLHFILLYFKLLGLKSDFMMTIGKIIERELLKTLDVVIQVNALDWPKNSLAMKEEDVDPEVLKKVKP